MSIELRAMGEDDRDEWNRHVERSPQTTPFHRYESLATIAEHTDADLHALAGYAGEEPVGLFPVFTNVWKFVSTTFSPPPDLAVSYLGPALLNMDKLKRRKRDGRHGRFIEACLEWIDTNVNASYVHVWTGPEYDDVRPLQWNGFEVTPAFTYHVDLTPDTEDLLASFSRDARSNINGRDEAAITVESGGSEAIRRIIDQVSERHDSLGEPYRLPADFAVNLYERLPDGRFYPYEIFVEGERVGGMLVLDDGSTVYRWQGGAKTDRTVPANDILDWHIMERAKERGVETYDLVHADIPRINQYKSKFNPQLKRYFRAERGSVPMRLAASAYRSIK